MKAVGLFKHLPIEDPQSLVDLDIQQPNLDRGVSTGERLLDEIQNARTNQSFEVTFQLCIFDSQRP